MIAEHLKRYVLTVADQGLSRTKALTDSLSNQVDDLERRIAAQAESNHDELAAEIAKLKTRESGLKRELEEKQQAFLDLAVQIEREFLSQSDELIARNSRARNRELLSDAFDLFSGLVDPELSTAELRSAQPQLSGVVDSQIAQINKYFDDAQETLNESRERLQQHDQLMAENQSLRASVSTQLKHLKDEHDIFIAQNQDSTTLNTPFSGLTDQSLKALIGHFQAIAADGNLEKQWWEGRSDGLATLKRLEIRSAK